MFFKADGKRVTRVKTRTKKQIDPSWDLQFIELVPGESYAVDDSFNTEKSISVETFRGVSRVNEGQPVLLWAESKDDKLGTEMAWNDPVNLCRRPMSDELVYLPTGEVFKSTDQCDWKHIVCLDEGLNKWLINCNLVVPKHVYKRI